MQDTSNAIMLSQQFLSAVRTGKNATPLVQELQSLSYACIQTALPSDKEKLAFWINLYNGFTQYLLQHQPQLYRNRNFFFGKKQICVAGMALSLDAIEHGILRHSKNKWSFGYLPKLFPSPQEKRLRVDRLDYRIHFALNCGAKSCPPVAFYTPRELDRQLVLAAKNYLSTEVRYEASQHTVWLPKLMHWFWKDFGGRRGILKLLSDHGLGGMEPSTKFRFNRYDWQLQLHHFVNSEP